MKVIGSYLTASRHPERLLWTVSVNGNVETTDDHCDSTLSSIYAKTLSLDKRNATQTHAHCRPQTNDTSFVRRHQLSYSLYIILTFVNLKMSALH